MTHPYRDHALDYLRAGWRGILPLRAGTKWPPPKDLTGWEGRWPSPADVQTWRDFQPTSNIALRMPEDVVGLDADVYGDKHGDRSLAQLEAELGPLPKTIMSTSREGTASGIRFFRCPPHASWPSQAASDIEMIHYGHRYAVVWPSIHPEGGTYRWIDQRTGEILERAIRADELPWLPDTWVAHLQERARSHASKADVADGEVRAWLDQLRAGAPCGKVADAAAATAEMEAGSRHDTMARLSARLIGFGAWGHAGTAEALTALYKAFLAAAVKPGERNEKTAVAEWRRAIAGAVAMQIEAHPQPSQVCSCPLPAFDPEVDDAFWEARPVLSHLRTFARARRCSPWAVFAIATVRAVAQIMPYIVLPPIIGGQASVNLFVGVVAPSGGGKGAAEACAADALDVGDLHSVGVGSGEGILHQYVRWVPPNNKTGEPGHIDQHTTSVVFTASEVDTLGALHSRQASTLLPELRKVYMGEELSFAYVDPTKRLKVARHHYRAGLIVGIQPARAGVLLEDSDGGTPQRFVWMPGVDPQMPHEAPDEPQPWMWKRPPLPEIVGLSGRANIDVCAEARGTIVAEHIKRNRGDGEALDGHALLTRLKWSFGLAALDGRVEVTEADWALGGVVMAMSDHVRGGVLQELAARRQAAAAAQGRAYGEREVVKEQIVADAAVQRVGRAVMRKLVGVELPRAELRRALASRDREHFDEAVSRLVDAGLVVAREFMHTTDDGLRQGVAYRVAGGVA